MTWNPLSAKGNRISFSEASALSACEYRWELQYRRQIGEPSKAMLKGTLLHTGAEAFWHGLDPYSAMKNQWWNDPEFAELSAAGDDETFVLAAWLMDRYERWYEPMRSEIKVIDTEIELEARVPGTKTTVMGHIDNLYEYKGQLWMVERKSYGRRDRLEMLYVDPQLSLYPWLAGRNGIPLHGVIFDGIYTQKWALEKPTQKQLIEEAEMKGTIFKTKTEARDWAREMVAAHPGLERPLADSFDWVTLDRTENQMERMVELWLKPAISRRHSLRRTGVPTRNIGTMSCRFCPVQQQCWDELAFGGTIEVEE